MSDLTPTATPFPTKYTRPVSSCKLGHGGGCEFVEEWISIHSQEPVAVKKIPQETLSKYSHLYYNEISALLVLQQSQVSGVVKFVEVLHAESGDSYLVLELVKGPTLNHHLFYQSLVRSLGSEQEYEQSMLDLGAQLVQTVERMHTAGVAHMDLSADNVMVQSATDIPSVKIIDFGLSRRIASVREARIDPLGANSLYAAPEVLDSMLSRCDPSFTGCHLVNGAAADVWSTGIMIFEALTSDLPFQTRPYRLPGIPEYVVQEDRRTWQQYAGIRLSQQLWADAVANAHRMDSAVRHQLIEKLELTSCQPSLAVDFFIQMLHPDPEARMTMAEAALHPFMMPAMQKLLSRETQVDAADETGSTHDFSPSISFSACRASASHSVSMPPSSNMLSCESISASLLSPLSCGSTAYRLYLISQHLRLLPGLSLFSNILAGILRRCCSKITQASATASKPAGRKTSQLEAKSRSPRPACTQRLQADRLQDFTVCNGQEVLGGGSEMDTAADRPNAMAMSSSSSSTTTSSCTSSDTESENTEANASCNASDIREEAPTHQAQRSWLQQSVRSLVKHKKSLLAGAAAGLAVGAGLWMTR